MTRTGRRFGRDILAALGLCLALLGGPRAAEAAPLSVTVTLAMNVGICETVPGLVVVVLPVSGSQSNQCGAQNAAVVTITGGTANQSVTATLPSSVTLKQPGFPSVTVNTFTFSTSAGQTFATNTGTFNLDATGSMTIYVGATAQAQPAGPGTAYSGSGNIKVL